MTTAAGFRDPPTFRIDVNAIDDYDRVGTTLRAALDVEGAYLAPPAPGNFALAIDSDGNVCVAAVERIDPNGWLRLQLIWETWRLLGTVDINTAYRRR